MDDSKERSKVGLPCACIGPMYGEPYCYCEMKAKGLPLNEDNRANKEIKRPSQRQLAKIKETK